jgi:hypothetical protein
MAPDPFYARGSRVLTPEAFEFVFGHYVAGDSWGELLANYNVPRGHLWPFVLVAVGAAPFIWARHPRGSRADARP